MLAGLILAAATAIAIAPPGLAEEGCPSPRQVTDALQARLPPAVLAAPGWTPAPGTLRVVVAAAPGAGLRVDLVDPNGDAVLHRQLPPPTRGRAECAALADTVALIVDRYLHDVGYEAPPLPPPVLTAAPPPPPPPPRGTRFAAGLALAGRLGDAGGLDPAGLLVLGVEGGRPELRVGARLAGGVAPALAAATRQAALRRLPIRLGLYLGLPVGPGRFEPGIGVGLDALVISGDFAARGTYVAPVGELAMGYGVLLGRHAYIRAAARGGVARPHTFVAGAEGREVWSTPRTYLELGVESGFLFP